MTILSTGLCVDLELFEGEDLLSEWRWFSGPHLRPILATAMGDLFLTGVDGAVSLLRTDLAELYPVANSVETFREMLKDDALVQDWFMLNLLHELRTAEVARGVKDVYGYVIPPVLGGEYSMENIRAVSLPGYLNFTGDVARQIADLPDGATVQLKIVE